MAIERVFDRPDGPPNAGAEAPRCNEQNVEGWKDAFLIIGPDRRSRRRVQHHVSIQRPTRYNS
jgi:hypothetical protein